MSTTDPTPRPSRKLVATATPGIYRRQRADGSLGGYVVIYRAAGRQRKESARTLAEARAIRSARSADDARGEFQARSAITLRTYLAAWIDRYQGTGRRGFREGTRDDYRRLLDQYAHRYFGERLRLIDVTPHTLAQFVAWIVAGAGQGRTLADSTVTNAVIPVRAALATAKREGLLRYNPADGLAMPVREQVRDDGEEVRALGREQLAALLAIAPAHHRGLLELLAGTGLRISEAIGLRRRDLRLDGSRPVVQVRRAVVRGRVEPPKSRHGRREVPLAPPLVDRLRAHMADRPDDPDALVFATAAGSPLDPNNLRRRMLKPLAEEAGASWAGFHTLRHTFASLQLAAGVNVVQLSRALGHHSASFTLDTYVHLLEGEAAPALDVAAALDGGNIGATRATETDRTRSEREGADLPA